MAKMFAWLADAPLFIDRKQLASFYDAVVQPVVEAGEVTINLDTKTTTTFALGGQATGGLEISPGKLIELLSEYLPSLKANVAATLEAKSEQGSEHQEGRTIKLTPIKTPQRQLVQLTLHYIANHPARLLNSRLEDRAGLAGLASVRPATLQDVPRVLTFLDLPGHSDAHGMGVLPTMFVPMAAEFEDGAIELPYLALETKDRKMAPRFPQCAGTEAPEELDQARKQYWKWFQETFDPHRSLVLVEQAASRHGRVRWISFQLPLSSEGRTLHLHVQPRGKYDTGTFTYGLINRGFENGVRLAGILKSGPELNVLAIYEK